MNSKPLVVVVGAFPPAPASVKDVCELRHYSNGTALNHDAARPSKVAVVVIATNVTGQNELEAAAYAKRTGAVLVDHVARWITVAKACEKSCRWLHEAVFGPNISGRNEPANYPEEEARDMLMDPPVQGAPSKPVSKSPSKAPVSGDDVEQGILHVVTIKAHTIPELVAELEYGRSVIRDACERLTTQGHLARDWRRAGRSSAYEYQLPNGELMSDNNAPPVLHVAEVPTEQDNGSLGQCMATTTMGNRCRRRASRSLECEAYCGQHEGPLVTEGPCRNASCTNAVPVYREGVDPGGWPHKENWLMGECEACYEASMPVDDPDPASAKATAPSLSVLGEIRDLLGALDGLEIVIGFRYRKK